MSSSFELNASSEKSGDLSLEEKIESLNREVLEAYAQLQSAQNFKPSQEVIKKAKALIDELNENKILGKTAFIEQLERIIGETKTNMNIFTN